MHLFIQIPCYNEEKTLPQVISNLPLSLPGISTITTLVIDDGSNDKTIEVAQSLGVTHIVHHGYNRGLAAAFHSGLDACLRLGADIIVNTDGDNQYPGDQIAKLIEPIVQGKADIVIGDRQTHLITHFSPLKKVLQQWGSWVVRLVSGTDVPDATSGFRAYSREAALRLTLLAHYTYTLETIIQAGKKGLRMAHIPIRVNQPLRESRLIKSNWSYIKRSAATIIRLYIFYEPFRTFIYLSLPFLFSGIVLLVRFAYFYFTELNGIGRHVQSVVIGGTALTIGFLLIVLGIMADLVAANRRLLEENLYWLKRQGLSSTKPYHPFTLENTMPLSPPFNSHLEEFK